MVGSSLHYCKEQENSCSMNLVLDDDILSFFESLEDVGEFPNIEDDVIDASFKELEETTRLVFQQNPTSSYRVQRVSLERETESETSPKRKRRPSLNQTGQKQPSFSQPFSWETNKNGDQKISHTAVERNRRKHMNEHLSVLKSLMPSFYLQKGDQASIIGGVVSYINELQQILKTLEGKKKRKFYSNEGLLNPSPRNSPLISPRTPQKISSSYQLPWVNKATGFLHSDPAIIANPHDPSPCSSSSTNSSIIESVRELFAASSKSGAAEVEVRFTGPNLLLKTVSSPFPGQVLKIMDVIEDLELEILHLDISTNEGAMVNTFTIKIGLECKISAEELAVKIQQTFC